MLLVPLQLDCHLVVVPLQAPGSVWAAAAVAVPAPGSVRTLSSDGHVTGVDYSQAVADCPILLGLL